MNRTLIVFCLTLSCSIAAIAEDNRMAIVGVGTHSCGMYLDYRSKKNETMEMLYEQWGAGFLAGHASGAKRMNNPVADLPTITAYIDKYCADNPLSNVVSAVNRLRGKLGSYR